MTSLPISDARTKLPELANRTAYGGERFVIERRGKDLCAIVSIEDLQLLEDLEKKEDLAIIRKRVHEPGRPWKKVKAELGL